jgi:uncharacterized protein YbjT (DUF2867 family)
MPVIVIGADTPLGPAIVTALRGRAGEIRAFVTDPAAAEALRSEGIKVAVGDVSDGSHVGAAALGCFGAVVLPEAANDGRERAFAAAGRATLESWVRALRDAAIRRVILIDDERYPGCHELFRDMVPEVAAVTTTDRDDGAIGREVARIDDLASLEGLTTSDEPG